ncbi:molybdenum cofactor guanylyltransferase MobA [Pseudorhodoferax sp.]|uniref:molybdenum cofactor guanylyltransferase MobA n=1 Tax=Pseudorhodoferax sp. TaxID=1993553 RepID=UPI0039E2FD19
MIAQHDITGLVLAGGRGSRMGGIDKGLVPFGGVPLALHALRRLQPQVGSLLINANRHPDVYAGFGVPVVRDAQPDFPGPLAGLLAGLAQARTPYLASVACDTPRFPHDLVARLAAALAAQPAAGLAMAAAPDAHGRLRPQPVFCLLRAGLQARLRDFLAAGGRKVGAWAAAEHAVLVPFDRAGDDPQAFANANTPEELQALERG